MTDHVTAMGTTVFDEDDMPSDLPPGMVIYDLDAERRATIAFACLVPFALLFGWALWIMLP